MFSTTYFILCEGNLSFFKIFISEYGFIISNFDTSQYVELNNDGTKFGGDDDPINNVIAWDKIILYYLGAFFIPIVMINLTVAVMSDTFERVMTTVNLTVGKDRNSLILNYENFLFWRRCPSWYCNCCSRRSNNDFYLYFVKY